MIKHAEEKKFLEFSRRHVLGLMGSSAAAIGFGLPGRVYADDDEMVVAHGYSFFGELKYPKDFPHFDYVNPNAPVGGEIAVATRGSFDGMNRFASKGRSGLYSGLIAESMFADGPFGTATPADRLTESYCLLAHTVEYPKSKRWCVFHMRPEARFADGSPLTAHDAAFTHNLFLEQGIRSYARAVKQRIKGVEVIDDHTLRYEFVDGISRRSLVSQVGGTPVFSKDWYERTGERLDEPSLNTPMGSGPYVVDDFEVNRYIVYKRNPDYWGWHVNVNKGRHNYDRVRVEYFADDAAEFEAFKSGVYTFRAEGSTKRWATGYDFPAIDKGFVKRQTLKSGTPPSPTGFIFNFQREKFQDKRVREAMALAFNFQWTSASLQYDLTEQRHSFVQNTEIEAKGVPEGLEKAFLESLGDVVPAEMMTEEAVLAHTSNPNTTVDRRNKRKALKLLQDVGWIVGDDGKLRNDAGEPFQVQFMLSSATSDTAEAIITTYVSNLQSFGFDAEMEKVDTAQMQQRFLDKDFDMLFTRNQSFQTSGTGLMQTYGSEQAIVSSWNPQSLQSPLVDAIIEASLETKSREEEVASLVALDRALRYLRIQVPVGYVADNWIASYDMYEHPEELPPLAVGYLDFWWQNEEKYEALKAAGAFG
ncbi:extracellular solute-binding protein [Cognatishimia activa]|uniref:Periplasmic oligopeptide-binding protein n=1 Tax=Cognatishimia activa TaxID=1715691 RepID=A0A0P1IRD3_9RHOB|nr:extracellular solute-binding protein [Cognatishimia activa]MEE2944473.1 extracellular solute-binding protein [Pseudomonadota bacterium]CUJ06094.1 Periplasmic oligopeptide-binding protein precursor [Cognatishimia activa]CUK26019.1 Periplasmic oligopeptide-binding protein precursor [Cognatishimia activa]